MTIELWDLDVPYEVIDDCTDEGVDIIKIRPNSLASDRDDTYDICLDYDRCQEFIRTLQFISKEIKSRRKK